MFCWFSLVNELLAWYVCLALINTLFERSWVILTIVYYVTHTTPLQRSQTIPLKEEKRLWWDCRCCGEPVSLLSPGPLYGPGREHAASPKQLFQVIFWRTAPFPLASSATCCLPYFTFFTFFFSACQGSGKRYISILIPITCHYMTQVMHLGQPNKALGYFSVLSIHSQNSLKYHWVPLRLRALTTFDLKGQLAN